MQPDTDQYGRSQVDRHAPVAIRGSWNQTHTGCACQDDHVTVTAIVVEDDDFTRTTVATALQSPMIDVLGTASNGREAMALIARGGVDCAVIDLDLGAGPTGIDLAFGMRRIDPSIGIVILTSFSDPRLLTSSTREPPEGATYLVKQALSDFGFLTAAVLGTGSADAQDSNEAQALTDSQAECLRLLAYGLSNAEIARIRVVTEKSVERTISRLAREWGVDAGGPVNQRVALARHYFTLTGAHRHSHAHL